MNMPTPRNKNILEAFQREIHEQTPGKAGRGTKIFLDYKNNISLKCLNNIKQEWQKSCLRIVADRRDAFWALSPSLTSFFWTHKFVFNPDSRRRHPETQIGFGKPGTKWVSLPKRPSSWCKAFCEPIFTKLLPKGCLWHGGWSSRTTSPLHPSNVFKQA